MPYTPHTWTDGPGGTPINAVTLNEMETGIDDADTRITTQASLVPHIPDNGHSVFAKGGVETSSRFNFNVSGGTSGRLWVSYFTAIENITVTKLAMEVRGGVAVTTTLAQLALFTVASTTDDSITKVAQTASDNTIGASGYTMYERVFSTVGSFPSSYALVAGTRYAIGYLHVATTAPDISGANLLLSSVPPTPSRIIDGQTDIAASYAVANINPFYFGAWLMARP